MTHCRLKTSHSDTVTQDEVLAMAHVLARRHADKAQDVALHFAGEHEAIGDQTRAEVWSRVAACFRTPGTAPTLS